MKKIYFNSVVKEFANLVLNHIQNVNDNSLNRITKTILSIFIFVLMNTFCTNAQVSISKPNLIFTSCTPTSPYYNLNNITISENQSSNFGVGTNVTLVMSAPSGFEFQPSNGSVSYTTSRNITSASINITSTIVSVTYSCNNTNRSDRLVISGLKVRSINSPNNGDIEFSNSSTGSILGIGSGTTFTNTIISYGVVNPSQASGLTFGTTTSNSIAGSFSGSADEYLVIRSTSATPPSQPVNGTYYSWGNIATLGPGLSYVQRGTSTSFSSASLSGNTRYYYYVYAYNNCLSQPYYNTLGPLTGNQLTCVNSPNSVSSSLITTNSFRINWTYPTGGNDGAVSYTIQVTTDASYTNNITGSPFTASAPTTQLNLTGLSTGTTYYYRIRSSNLCNSNYVTGNETTSFGNDECSSAIPLTVSTTCNYSTYNNIGATNSVGVPAPGCAYYNGNDVWFSVVVPASGLIDVDMTQGSMTDSGMAFYSGSCAGLTLIECDDDDSPNGFMSYISASGLTPGNTIYIRVWGYGGSTGSFGICATTITCVPPSNVNALIVSATSVTLNWTAPIIIPGSGYQYFVTSTNVVPTDLTTPTGSTGPGVTSVTLIGLTSGTTYDFWIRSNCGASDRSTWVGPTRFKPCSVGTGNGTSLLSCPSIVAGENGGNGADPTVLCSSTCTDLQATYTDIKQTNTYTVQSITYAPPYQFGCLRNAVSVNVDDVWSNTIDLPFNFCFYGTNFNKVLIGSNGNLTFDTTNNLPGGFNAWQFNTNIPSTSLPRNTIFGVYHDIDPSVGGEIGWELVTLNSGCRALIASWNNVPMFSNVCNSILYTGMMVLYENTNVIEIYIKEKNVCSSWNNGNAIVGIQNSTGTLATVAPNRNGLDPDWTVSNEAWRFTPNGASVASVKWFEGNDTSGTQVGNTDIITVCPTETKTYTAQVTYNLCNAGPMALTDNTTVNVTGNKTWNGSVDSDWNKANNWTPNGIPNNTNCIMVPAVAINPIISSANYNAFGHNITVKNGANLNLEPTVNITITDFVKVEPTGLLKVKNSANLIQINNSAPNTGSISMDRITNIRKTDYVYWSSPVVGFSSSAVIPDNGNFIYKWNTTVANPNGGFGNWVGGIETMEIGKGYIARGPNSFSTSSVAPFTATFNGAPNNGIIQPSITRGTYTGIPYAGTNGVTITNLDDNWNLIGNPYPSAINATAFLLNNTNIQGSVRLWTHGSPISSAFSSPFYYTFQYNYNINDYVNFNGTGSTPPGFNGKIASGQGFFVNMIDGPTATSSVTFNNSLRGNSHNNSQFYRSSAVNTSEISEFNRIWLSIVNISGNAATTLVGYVTDATNDEDRIFDASHKPANELGIYSYTQDKPLIIQGRQLPFDNNDTVAIGVSVPANGIYNLAISLVDGLFENNTQNIYLEDTFTNTIHDIRQAPYTFNAVTGIYNNRFILRYTNNNTLGNNEFNDNDTFAFISNDILNVKSTQNISKIEVFDLTGKLVITYDTKNYSNSFESHFNFAKGVYITKIELDNENTVSKKLMN